MPTVSGNCSDIINSDSANLGDRLYRGREKHALRVLRNASAHQVSFLHVNSLWKYGIKQNS